MSLPFPSQSPESGTSRVTDATDPTDPYPPAGDDATSEADTNNTTSTPQRKADTRATPWTLSLCPGVSSALPPAPQAKAKWVTASVADNAATVIGKVFDEAERRDPRHRRTWVALVDGNNHQIHRIEAEAKDRGADITIVVDLIHVLEYLWDAVWCFFAEGDTAAEAWVADRALAVLQGHARDVATGIKRRATAARLAKNKRIKADACATYLTNKADYLDYPTALAEGWPIASGVIEGTCRYLVADRMDITGARWSVNGAEAVLKLRAIRANNDFDEYWKFHLDNERQRVHETRYANGTLPMAA